jgi:hypothetical protein
MVRARFQIDVKRSAPSLVAGVLQCANLGVLDACVGMSSSADNVPVPVYNDGAYVRIGRGQANALAGKIQCAL